MIGLQVTKKEVKTEPAAAKKTEEKKEPVKKSSGIEAAFSKVSAKKPSPVKSETAAKKPAVAAKAGKGSISSMFAKQSSKPKPVKTAAEEKENIVNQRIEENVKEEKKVENTNKPLVQSRDEACKAKAKSKQDDSKKRKRIQVSYTATDHVT